MFEPFDNISDENARFVKPRSVLRGMRERFLKRWELIHFAKYVINEYLNGPDDIESIVDTWLKENNDAT